jgi:hypothetical protein
MKWVRLYSVRELRYLNEPVLVAVLDEKLIPVQDIGFYDSDLNWFSAGGLGDVKYIP